MMLRTLGGLTLEGSAFSRPKPLLLLAYLALEGSKDRHFLADLFWMEASDRLNRLSTALSRLRKAVPGAVEADHLRVSTQIGSDVREFLRAVDADDAPQALDLYRGPFLDGIYLRDWGEELEEWVYGTREYLAAKARNLLIRLGEREAAATDFAAAAARAEAAYRLPGAPEIEPAKLPLLHTLLLAGGSPLEPEVRSEAEAFEVQLIETPGEARERLVEAALDPVTGAISRLPAETTPFVGRKRELGELRSLLTGEPKHRLVTILGPGGIGKTRLALQLAAELEGSFRHGALFVPLTGATTELQILDAIAHSLGLPGRAGDPRELLGRYLRERELLLVLDNFEAAVEAAPFVADLLTLAERLAVVATSRERLELAGETVYPLAGLTFVSSSRSGSDALKLLLDRASMVRASRAFTSRELEHAAEICKLVQGMPLALVLAAGWLELLPMEEVAAEIRKSLSFLEAEMQDLPPRQRSVRAVFDYSWKGLDDHDAQAFARLSVFRRGFTRDAARAVASAGLQTLRRFIHKSLLYAKHDGRFEIHELLRQYGEERLAESGGRAEIEERHAKYFLEQLVHASADLLGSNQMRALTALVPDAENFRAAFRHAAEQADFDLLRQALSPFYVLHVLTGRYSAGYRTYRHAAESLAAVDSVDPVLLARVRTHEGALLARIGEFARAQSLIEAQLPYLDAPGDRAFAFESLGNYVHYFLGDIDLALERLQGALRLYTEAGDKFGVARVLFFEASVHWHEGDFGRAERLLQESSKLASELGSSEWSALCDAGLGVVAHGRGDLARARTLLEKAVVLLEGLKLTHAGSNANSNLGQVLIECGEIEPGLERLERALQGIEKVGDPVLAAEAHARIGNAHLLLGERERAQEHFGRSLSITLEHGFESALAIIGYADLVRDSDPDAALALYLFATEHVASAYVERAFARERFRSLRPVPEQLVRARDIASMASFREIAENLLRSHESPAQPPEPG